MFKAVIFLFSLVLSFNIWASYEENEYFLEYSPCLGVANDLNEESKAIKEDEVKSCFVPSEAFLESEMKLKGFPVVNNCLLPKEDLKKSLLNGGDLNSVLIDDFVLGSCVVVETNTGFVKGWLNKKYDNIVNVKVYVWWDKGKEKVDKDILTFFNFVKNTIYGHLGLALNEERVYIPPSPQQPLQEESPALTTVTITDESSAQEGEVPVIEADTLSTVTISVEVEEDYDITSPQSTVSQFPSSIDEGSEGETDISKDERLENFLNILEEELKDKEEQVI